MSTMAELRAAKYAFREEYGHVEGITGYGIGDNCLRIMVREPGLTFPAEYHGVRVEIVVTGEIVAQIQVEDPEALAFKLEELADQHIERMKTEKDDE